MSSDAVAPSEFEARAADIANKDEDTVATELAARIKEILAPYDAEREGENGFPAIVAREADEIVAMSHSHHQLAESVAAYRRKLADQEAITQVILDALVASEHYRAASGPARGETGAGRPPRASKLVQQIVAALYPDGVPTDLPPADLTKEVQQTARAQKFRKVPSRRTVDRVRTALVPRAK